MAEAHPVGFRWPMKAKEKGGKIIHVDPRFTRTSAVSDLYVPIRAGSDIAFLGGLINYVLTNERWFKEYVLAYTNASVLIDGRFRIPKTWRAYSAATIPENAPTTAKKAIGDTRRRRNRSRRRRAAGGRQQSKQSSGSDGPPGQERTPARTKKARAKRECMATASWEARPRIPTQCRVYAGTGRADAPRRNPAGPALRDAGPAPPLCPLYARNGVANLRLLARTD